VRQERNVPSAFHPGDDRSLEWHPACSTVRVRVLWVKAGKLLPVDTGGKIRSYNILKQLARRHQVTLLSYYCGPGDREYEAALQDRFPGAVVIHTAAPDGGGLRQALDFAWRTWLPAPYAVAKFTSAAVRRRIEEWDGQRAFDVAVCDFLAPSQNFPPSLRTPTVLFQHNVESMLWERRAAAERHPAKRWVAFREARKMLRCERETVARFPHVIAVSEIDRAAMADMTDVSRISVVPTGVDAHAFRPEFRNETPSPEVLFLGSMDWEPNIDAVQYFCERMWPSIRSAVPEARFRVVGRNPPLSVRRLASDSVEIVGRVPSVTEHLYRAAVFVVPLRAGGGTRLKIYEAMGAAKAVVSTSIGAEGLDVRDGENIVIADDPSAFTSAVIHLLRDGIERRRLEDGALLLAERYDWSAVAAQFEDQLRGVAEGGTRLAPIPRSRAVA
jgi:glycosyltransferase involved in cell wall biosynthesis